MKPWIIIVSALVVGSVVGGGVFYARTQSADTPEMIQAPTPTPTPQEESVWTDEAGFSFSYPKDVVIDKHDEDQQNYAHVELTHPNHPGNLIVWAKDLPTGVSDAKSWAKKEKQFAGASLVDTTLGGEPAQKLIILSPAKKLFVGTVFDELLWYTEATVTDEPYWLPVFERVVESFILTDSTSATPQNEGASDGANDVSVDEEEVL